MSFKGNPVSQGIAIGEVYIYRPFSPVISETKIDENEVDRYIARYEAAKEAAAKELAAIVSRMELDDPEKAKIFTAHKDILFDEAIDEDVRELITEDFYSPDWAINKIFEKYIRILGKNTDELIKERVADLRDVRNRLLRCWAGQPEKNLAFLPRPSVVVAEDLFPSDTATLDRDKVLAILTEVGGPTSHSAIIARSYEIPAILGITGLIAGLKDGETLIVDAISGSVITAPDADAIKAYESKRKEFAVHAAEVKQFLGKPPLTKDGVHIDVDLNIGSANAQELEGCKYTDGVGLFRTEFLYMGKEQLPTEEEQFAIYKKVLTAYGDRPVTLRTLDIGGDKKLDSIELPFEENPFLGRRALRLCFAMPEMFKTQLRAALRASMYGNLWIMLPMVESLDDIRRAKGYVEEVKQELDAQGIAYNKNCKLGIMIEIPSIAIIADQAAKEVDFASIGTNDLCQYSTAVDRLSPTVAEYYQGYHPALFRLIGYTVSEFNKAKKSICVCGEMGGDPLAASVLVGLGMRKLSMGLASVAGIKKMLSGLTIEHAERIAKAVVNLPTASEVEAHIRKELEGIL